MSKFKIIMMGLIAVFAMLGLNHTQVFANSYYMQPRSEQTNIMYFFELPADLSMDDYIALKLVQGVVNRNSPRFLINQRLAYFTEADIHWKQYYEDKGYRFVQLNTIGEVYNTFKSYFNGTVTYNHTFNTDTYHWPEAEMAAVAGALTDRIPILSSRQTEFETRYGLYAASTLTLTDSFSDDYDAASTINGHLENYGWTTPLQAYQWGYDNLLKYCNSHGYQNMCDESIDLVAGQKLFFAHLRSTDPGEFALLKNIYGYLQARNKSFPVWGWVSQEDSDINAMAAYGGYLLLDGSTNLSFHDKLPATGTVYKHNIEYTTSNTTLESDKYYITFMASEPSTPKAISSFQHGAWLDSNRGNVPINWGLLPYSSMRFPGLTEYYYSTATENDYFYAGDASPLGFTDYDNMPFAAQEEIKQLGTYYAQKVDQRYLDLYSPYGAIGAYNKAIYAELAFKTGMQGITAPLPSQTDHEVWTDNAGEGVLVINRPNMYPARQTDFSDDFSHGSGQWTPGSGIWTINGGAYNQGGTQGRHIAKAGSSSWSYVNYKGDVKKLSAAAGSTGLALRAGAGDNYYWFYLKDGNSTGIKKVVNGAETVLKEIPFAHNPDQSYTMKVVANGQSLKGYITYTKSLDTGVGIVQVAQTDQIFDITDSTFASGQIGLAANCNAEFDNIKVVSVTQAQQIVNYIKSQTVDASKAKPFFLPAYYGYVFTGDFDTNMLGSEPAAGEVMAVSPTDLKTVMDSINASYPGQFKFTRLDEMMSAARIAYTQLDTSDTVSPVATAVEGPGNAIALNSINSTDLRVRITENANIAANSATLKWNVPGKSGTGSAALTGSSTSGVDIAFIANNVNLDTGITGGVDVGDTVNFWVEGSDAAGNPFYTVNNSLSDPMASVTVAKNQVDAEKFNGWSISQGSMVEKASNEKKNGSYSLKAVFQNASWQLVHKTGTWDASDFDGIGFWVKGTINQTYVKCMDVDGTTFQSAAAITPNHWTYVYVPFTSNVSGGDGVFDPSKITWVQLMYDPALGGSGATYYYDDIEFIKDRIIHVDQAIYKDWFIHNASILTASADGPGDSYSLKAVYGGTSSDWQFANSKGKWNAYNCNGLGLWINSSLPTAYLKLLDADGTACEAAVAAIPHVWSYVYLPFTSNVNGGDGVFNSDSIVDIQLMFYRGFGDGSSYYGYYYSNIDFIKTQTSQIDSENYENWIGSTYNSEVTGEEKHNGNYSLKTAFFNDGAQWQHTQLGGSWDASSYSKIGLWIKAPLANGYIKVLDSDGTSFESNVALTPNTWTYVTVPFTSNVNGGDGIFNPERITFIQLIYYTGWGRGDNSYIYYYDDLEFTN